MEGGDALTVLFRVLGTRKKENNICWYKFEVESGRTGEQEKPAELSPFMEINQATESAIVYLDPFTYCIGGLYYCEKAKTNRSSNHVYRLSRFHKTGQGSKHGWEKVRNMKKFRQRPQAVSINGKIYVMGGLYPKQEVKQRGFGDDWAEVYDPDTGEWNPVDVKNHENDTVKRLSAIFSSGSGESSYSRNPVVFKRKSHKFKRVRSFSSGFGDSSILSTTPFNKSLITNKEPLLLVEKKQPRTVYEFLNSSNDHYDYSCLTMEGYDSEHILLVTNDDHYYLYNTKNSSMVEFEKNRGYRLDPLGTCFVDRQTLYEIDWDSGLVLGYDLSKDVTLKSTIPFFDGLNPSIDEVGMSILLKLKPSTNDTPMQVHVIWFGDCQPDGNLLLHYRNISYTRPEGITTQLVHKRPVILQQKVECTKSFILPGAYLLDGLVLSKLTLNHTGGSAPFEPHEEKLKKEEGKTPTQLEKWKFLHKKKQGEGDWISEAAKQIAENYAARMAALSEPHKSENVDANPGADTSENPGLAVDNLVIWSEITGGRYKNRLIGFGPHVKANAILGDNTCSDAYETGSASIGNSMDVFNPAVFETALDDALDRRGILPDDPSCNILQSIDKVPSTSTSAPVLTVEQV